MPSATGWSIFPERRTDLLSTSYSPGMFERRIARIECEVLVSMFRLLRACAERANFELRVEVELALIWSKLR
jgi:hypothetical protein